MRDDARDDGYDDFLDAVEEGEPYYLESPSGNGWLPHGPSTPKPAKRSYKRRTCRSVVKC
ncbi:hypothetical protein [Halovenus salina]|uniref:Uncharacterized protein n=1 Tax=Halovenus salina TaxID=1510225 RepID=A0ABD5VZX1_9EURY